MVVSAAVVLVKQLSQATIELCDDPEPTHVNVSSHALADLITAVREMQQAGKALDADKQLELIGADE
jgi:hypothetical protein